MQLDSEQIRETIAAEYVLGTLPSRVERWVEKRLPHRPALARAVSEWEERLHRLAFILKPVPVPEIVWQTLSQRTGYRAAEPRQSISTGIEEGLASALAFWRRFALAAASVAVALLVTLVWQSDDTPSAVEDRPVLVDQSTPVEPSVEGPAASGISLQPYDRLTLLENQEGRVGWLVQADARTSTVRVRAVNVAPVSSSEDLELWVLPQSGSPVSIGLLPRAGTQNYELDVSTVTRLEGATGLAVSIEPRGGSPTGLPTGPVVYQGQLVTVPPAP